MREEKYVEAAEALFKKMNAGFAPESEEIEEDEYERKLESALCYLIRFILENIRKTKNELEAGEHAESNPDCSCYADPSYKSDNPLNIREKTLYPEKEIVKRYKD
ncbi:MAG: hypothetical protein HGB20_01980 [Chlorobiaceae bacterium]|nr:hypothetical protein [Chlorobiaceae bacterium]